MDRRRFSEIAHRGIALWNPLPVEETFRIVDTLGVAPDARVLDIGCGTAELLVRLLARTGARGVGIDSAAGCIAAARANATRLDSSRIDLREEAFDATRLGEATFDVALCIGATHAAGGLVPTLRAMRRVLVPGGTALVGEGHWMREPDPDYLSYLDTTRDELLDHAANLRVMTEEGFDAVRSVVSSQTDFDRYEGPYAANVERFVAERPDDPDASAMLERIRGWRAAYLRWGRDTLGFALYVLRSAPSGANGGLHRASR